MKILLRCSFIALIVLGVVIQVTGTRRGEPDGKPMASLSAGLERLHLHTSGATSAEVLTGVAPSCGQPIHARLLRIDGSQDEWLRDIRLNDEVIRYVYLGSVSENRDKVRLLSHWIWANVRHIAGWRTARPRFELVLIVLPRSCPDLATLDWASLSPRD
jgi:hypothetical protein